MNYDYDLMITRKDKKESLSSYILVLKIPYFTLILLTSFPHYTFFKGFYLISHRSSSEPFLNNRYCKKHRNLHQFTTSFYKKEGELRDVSIATKYLIINHISTLATML